jgi:WD40 repeat protein
MGSEIGEIWFFEVKGFEFIGKSRGHSAALVNLKWSPDDKQITSVSRDGSICIWNFYKILSD